METSILVDSNVYIALLRSGRDPGEAIFSRYDDTDVAVCGMVQLEVLRGVKSPKAQAGLKARFSVMQNLVTDNRLWQQATDLAWTMDRQGKTIPGPDLVIAACALRANAAVHTYDGHFKLVPGLRVYCDSL
ncbi:MAG: PIN domain-containing protein [Verrucomicrobiales bacterium]